MLWVGLNWILNKNHLFRKKSINGSLMVLEGFEVKFHSFPNAFYLEIVHANVHT